MFHIITIDTKNNTAASQLILLSNIVLDGAYVN